MRKKDNTEDNILISLITSVYNTEDIFLEELAYSVFNQVTEVKFEWLILDNGSEYQETINFLEKLLVTAKLPDAAISSGG